MVAASGYPATTIAAICTEARVSPNTFYEHFAAKLDCFLAAYERFAEGLLKRIGAAIDPEAGWEGFIESSLSVYLGALEDDPEAARAFLVEGEAAGPAARALRREALGRFAALIEHRHEQIRAADPSLAQLPGPVYLGFVYGIRAMASDRIEADPNPELRSMAPAIGVWLQAAVLGAAAAESGQTPG